MALLQEATMSDNSTPTKPLHQASAIPTHSSPFHTPSTTANANKSDQSNEQYDEKDFRTSVPVKNNIKSLQPLSSPLILSTLLHKSLNQLNIHNSSPDQLRSSGAKSDVSNNPLSCQFDEVSFFKMVNSLQNELFSTSEKMIFSGQTFLDSWLALFTFYYERYCDEVRQTDVNDGDDGVNNLENSSKQLNRNFYAFVSSTPQIFNTLIPILHPTISLLQDLYKFIHSTPSNNTDKETLRDQIKSSQYFLVIFLSQFCQNLVQIQLLMTEICTYLGLNDDMINRLQTSSDINDDSPHIKALYLTRTYSQFFLSLLVFFSKYLIKIIQFYFSNTIISLLPPFIQSGSDNINTLWTNRMTHIEINHIGDYNQNNSQVGMLKDDILYYFTLLQETYQYEYLSQQVELLPKMKTFTMFISRVEKHFNNYSSKLEKIYHLLAGMRSINISEAVGDNNNNNTIIPLSLFPTINLGQKVLNIGNNHTIEQILDSSTLPSLFQYIWVSQLSLIQLRDIELEYIPYSINNGIYRVIGHTNFIPPSTNNTQQRKQISSNISISKEPDTLIPQDLFPSLRTDHQDWLINHLWQFQLVKINYLLPQILSSSQTSNRDNKSTPQHLTFQHQITNFINLVLKQYSSTIPLLHYIGHCYLPISLQFPNQINKFQRLQRVDDFEQNNQSHNSFQAPNKHFQLCQFFSSIPTVSKHLSQTLTQLNHQSPLLGHPSTSFMTSVTDMYSPASYHFSIVLKYLQEQIYTFVQNQAHLLYTTFKKSKSVSSPRNDSQDMAPRNEAEPLRKNVKNLQPNSLAKKGSNDTDDYTWFADLLDAEEASRDDANAGYLSPNGQDSALESSPGRESPPILEEKRSTKSQTHSMGIDSDSELDLGEISDDDDDDDENIENVKKQLVFQPPVETPWCICTAYQLYNPEKVPFLQNMTCLAPYGQCLCVCSCTHFNDYYFDYLNTTCGQKTTNESIDNSPLIAKNTSNINMISLPLIFSTLHLPSTDFSTHNVGLSTQLTPLFQHFPLASSLLTNEQSGKKVGSKNDNLLTQNINNFSPKELEFLSTFFSSSNSLSISFLITLLQQFTSSDRLDPNTQNIITSLQSQIWPQLYPSTDTNTSAQFNNQQSTQNLSKKLPNPTLSRKTIQLPSNKQYAILLSTVFSKVQKDFDIFKLAQQFSLPKMILENYFTQNNDSFDKLLQSTSGTSLLSSIGMGLSTLTSAKAEKDKNESNDTSLLYGKRVNTSPFLQMSDFEQRCGELFSMYSVIIGIVGQINEEFQNCLGNCVGNNIVPYFLLDCPFVNVSNPNHIEGNEQGLIPQNDNSDNNNNNNNTNHSYTMATFHSNIQYPSAFALLHRQFLQGPLSPPQKIGTHSDDFIFPLMLLQTGVLSLQSQLIAKSAFNSSLLLYQQSNIAQNTQNTISKSTSRRTPTLADQAPIVKWNTKINILSITPQFSSFAPHSWSLFTSQYYIMYISQQLTSIQPVEDWFYSHFSQVDFNSNSMKNKTMKNLPTTNSGAKNTRNLSIFWDYLNIPLSTLLPLLTNSDTLSLFDGVNGVNIDGIPGKTKTAQFSTSSQTVLQYFRDLKALHDGIDPHSGGASTITPLSFAQRRKRFRSWETEKDQGGKHVSSNDDTVEFSLGRDRYMYTYTTVNKHLDGVLEFITAPFFGLFPTPQRQRDEVYWYNTISKKSSNQTKDQNNNLDLSTSSTTSSPTTYTSISPSQHPHPHPFPTNPFSSTPIYILENAAVYYTTVLEPGFEAIGTFLENVYKQLVTTSQFFLDQLFISTVGYDGDNFLDKNQGPLVLSGLRSLSKAITGGNETKTIKSDPKNNNPQHSSNANLGKNIEKHPMFQLSNFFIEMTSEEEKKFSSNEKLLLLFHQSIHMFYLFSNTITHFIKSIEHIYSSPQFQITLAFIQHKKRQYYLSQKFSQFNSIFSSGFSGLSSNQSQSQSQSRTKPSNSQMSMMETVISQFYQPVLQKGPQSTPSCDLIFSPTSSPSYSYPSLPQSTPHTTTPYLHILNAYKPFVNLQNTSYNLTPSQSKQLYNLNDEGYFMKSFISVLSDEEYFLQAVILKEIFSIITSFISLYYQIHPEEMYGNTPPDSNKTSPHGDEMNDQDDFFDFVTPSTGEIGNKNEKAKKSTAKMSVLEDDNANEFYNPDGTPIHPYIVRYAKSLNINLLLCFYNALAQSVEFNNDSDCEQIGRMGSPKKTFSKHHPYSSQLEYDIALQKTLQYISGTTNLYPVLESTTKSINSLYETSGVLTMPYLPTQTGTLLHLQSTSHLQPLGILYNVFSPILPVGISGQDLVNNYEKNQNQNSPNQVRLDPHTSHNSNDPKNAILNQLESTLSPFSIQLSSEFSHKVTPNNSIFSPSLPHFEHFSTLPDLHNLLQLVVTNIPLVDTIPIVSTDNVSSNSDSFNTPSTTTQRKNTQGDPNNVRNSQLHDWLSVGLITTNQPFLYKLLALLFSNIPFPTDANLLTVDYLGSVNIRVYTDIIEKHQSDQKSYIFSIISQLLQYPSILISSSSQHYRTTERLSRLNSSNLTLLKNASVNRHQSSLPNMPLSSLTTLVDIRSTMSSSKAIQEYFLSLLFVQLRPLISFYIEIPKQFTSVFHNILDQFGSQQNNPRNLNNTNNFLLKRDSNTKYGNDPSLILASLTELRNTHQPIIDKTICLTLSTLLLQILNIFRIYSPHSTESSLLHLISLQIDDYLYNTILVQYIHNMYHMTDIPFELHMGFIELVIYLILHIYTTLFPQMFAIVHQNQSHKQQQEREQQQQQQQQQLQSGSHHLYKYTYTQRDSFANPISQHLTKYYQQWYLQFLYSNNQTKANTQDNIHEIDPTKTSTFDIESLINSINSNPECTAGVIQNVLIENTFIELPAVKDQVNIDNNVKHGRVDDNQNQRYYYPNLQTHSLLHPTSSLLTPLQPLLLQSTPKPTPVSYQISPVQPLSHVPTLFDAFPQSTSAFILLALLINDTKSSLVMNLDGIVMMLKMGNYNDAVLISKEKMRRNTGDINNNSQNLSSELAPWQTPQNNIETQQLTPAKLLWLLQAKYGITGLTIQQIYFILTGNTNLPTM
jgi:hypothetical protein